MIFYTPNFIPKIIPIMTSLRCDQKQKMQMSMSMHRALHVLQMSLSELILWLQDELPAEDRLEYKEMAGSSWDVQAQVSLFEHLMQQARCVFNNAHDLEEAEWVIGNLDERGFFTIADRDVSLGVLEKIQTFDPPGIAARSLQECLLVQLRIQGKKESLAHHILSSYFQEFMHRKWHKIPCTRAELEDAICKDMHPLSMRPADAFAHVVAVQLTADLICEKKEKGWEIFVNEEGLPRSLPSYVIRRKNTLQLLGTEIVYRQSRFLLGQGDLIPMTMEDVALSLGLHTSTIARAVSNKYILSPRGFVSMKELFTHSLGEGVSNRTVKDILVHMIAQEDKVSPLSDEKLVRCMAGHGIYCSRRAITKYRRTLRIPSSCQRRNEFS